LRLKKYSRKRETPTAVIRSNIFGALRMGLYAIFSTRKPRSPVIVAVMRKTR